ncbi:MAG: hypothetical protein QM664_10270 [Flavihumibacter sp.]
MNLTKNLLVAVCAFPVLALSSCGKNDDKPKASKTALLTEKSWKIISFISKDGTESVDIFKTAKPCEKDNVFLFKTDNTLVMEEGAIKCAADDPDSYSGPWAFADNESKLRFSLGTDEDDITYNIDVLSDTELKVILLYPDAPDYSEIITFRH